MTTYILKFQVCKFERFLRVIWRSISVKARY